MRGLAAFAFEEDHHHVGEDEVEFLVGSEGLVEFFGLEFRIPILDHLPDEEDAANEEEDSGEEYEH